MGSGFDKYEIINTPEAKGMRTLPSSRGQSLNVGQLVARRGVGLKSVYVAPIGRSMSAEEYQYLKANAVTSAEAARALQLLQADPAKPDNSHEHETLRLTSDFGGLDDTEMSRSDCQIAAGRQHLIATVNAAWGVFDKAGRLLLRRNFSDMFSELIDNLMIFSPKVVYDHFRDGWIMSACARRIDDQSAYILLAYSKGSDPLGDWWIWALDARYDGGNRTGNWADGLGLSVDNTSLYLTANMFGSQGHFVYAKLRILNKKELNIGGVLHGWDFWQLRNGDGSAAFGLQPAANLRAAGAQYLLNASADGQGLTQWTIQQPSRQTPVLTRRFIPTVSYQVAPDARQPAIDRLIDTGDTRLCGVVFRHGFLWTAHTISANWGDDVNVAAIQWFQVNPRAGVITQQGIFGAPHFYYFCPAVTVDGEGDMILVFNRSGDPDFPEIRFAGRGLSDEINTLQASASLQLSSSTGPSEWSICSGASTASDDLTIWIMSQYAATEVDWATWIGSIVYRQPSGAVNSHQESIYV